ncbi:hypothetical protein CBM2586_A10292 [Cupriavidus phytorum]|uniref:Uncharacterized protein n=1 Tax=Cupriavidus taiwanensis TaxID=164546 RepID=A0A975ZVN5_9BURK|nr:hypothetical protein CBM2586_A10292 [Cupriavidus taiwanensis]
MSPGSPRPSDIGYMRWKLTNAVNVAQEKQTMARVLLDLSAAQIEELGRGRSRAAIIRDAIQIPQPECGGAKGEVPLRDVGRSQRETGLPREQSVRMGAAKL